ncbi:MAG: tRNA (adenosine(37)-N6)-threonylcarbamoyltransferase complex ATPase subunit type 1 TsaE [Deltaproteobacteria bacterium CG11_big_fil_rev_8_21_14_0_20_47_16]|nr:MAG: tRNA (adenosine(37)-N6)-threonylcarbamoyltransferase complex ATPase subunit type 1 TsaE [Deltaproteobacteria bacterium CG11_big_fil_rev_8_21_14_0_20_47_16]
MKQTATTLEDTYRIAAELAATLKPGDTVALSGDLGAGKTTFVRGITMALHGHAKDVTSPTFTLMNIYEGTPPIYHFDWYRIDSLASLQTLGMEEYLEGTGIAIVEWGEKFPQELPAKTRHIRISLNTDGTRHFSGI